MIFPDFLGGNCRDADTVDNRPMAPWLADAKTIHIADPHIRHHLRRRYRNHLGILERIDAVGGQPVIQPHGMRTGWKSLGESIFALVAGHQLGERSAIHCALVSQFFRQRNGLAVIVESHQDRHVFFLAADAHLHAVDQTRQHMCGIQLAVGEFVAHTGP